MYSSTSYVVMTTTLVPARVGSPEMAAVAAMPSRRGMRTSIRTMSGLSRRTTAIASMPSSAAPTPTAGGAALSGPAGTAAVVADGQVQPGRAGAQRHRHRRGVRVADRVGQRLLDDAKQRELGERRQRGQVVGEVDDRVQAG